VLLIRYYSSRSSQFIASNVMLQSYSKIYHLRMLLLFSVVYISRTQNMMVQEDTAGEWWQQCVQKAHLCLRINDKTPYFPYQSCTYWLSALLYDNMFALCPHVRHLFDWDFARNGTPSLIRMVSKVHLGSLA
jgi:hypothetical protein